MTALGTIALWLTGLLACWSLLAGVAGSRIGSQDLLESSRRAAIAPAPLLAVATFCLAIALARHDFNVAYVADHTSRNLDVPLALAALTADWNGMLLGVLFVFCLAATALLRPAEDKAMVLTVAALILGGVVVLVSGGNPFVRLGTTPLDGHGLDPVLRAPVLLERPLALLGYAALGIAVASLVSRRRVLAGRSLTVAWTLLGAALAVGLWNVYRISDASGVPIWGTARWCTLAVWIGVGGARLVRRVSGRPALASWFATPAAIATMAGGGCLLIGALAVRHGPARDFRLKAGATAEMPAAFGSGFLLTHMGISRFQSTDRVTVAATLDVDRGDRPIGLITSDRRQYFGLMGQPVGDPVTGIGLHRGLLQDVRAVFREGATDEAAQYHVRVVPLMSLIWVGAGMVLLSGILSLLEPWRLSPRAKRGGGA